MNRMASVKTGLRLILIAVSVWIVRLLHVRNGNCKYHLGEETFKLAQSYMDKLAKHGHHANKAALYGELCALLFAKSHYDEVRRTPRHDGCSV